MHPEPPKTLQEELIGLQEQIQNHPGSPPRFNYNFWRLLGEQLPRNLAPADRDDCHAEMAQLVLVGLKAFGPAQLGTFRNSLSTVRYRRADASTLHYRPGRDRTLERWCRTILVAAVTRRDRPGLLRPHPRNITFVSHEALGGSGIHLANPEPERPWFLDDPDLLATAAEVLEALAREPASLLRDYYLEGRTFRELAAEHGSKGGIHKRLRRESLRAFEPLLAARVRAESACRRGVPAEPGPCQQNAEPVSRREIEAAFKSVPVRAVQRACRRG